MMIVVPDSQDPETASVSSDEMYGLLAGVDMEGVMGEIVSRNHLNDVAEDVFPAASV